MLEEPLLQVSVDGTQAPVARRFRSTWVISSLQMLRAHALYERYLAELAPKFRPEILEAVAGTWLAMEAAHAHYAACDRMRLSVEEQLKLGHAVGGIAQGTVLSTLVRAAKGVGVTPWTIMPHFHRLWIRAVDGGVSSVYRIGPKEARSEFTGCELLDIAYFRNGLRGVLLRSGALFCKAAYIHELPQRRSGEVKFRMQWA